MPNVSVIIPVYNVELYLKDCLDSIVNQTLNNIEIICVNDGSTDNSLTILEEYAQKDDRIRIINQSNTGQGVARNNGIKLATGEYIGFVDPDDWIDTSMYEKMYDVAKTNDCDLVECLYKKYYDANEITRTVISKDIKPFYNSVINLKEMPQYLCMGHCAVVWNKLIKRELVINNNIEFEDAKMCEDHIVSFSSRMFANKIYLLAEHLYYYRQRENSACYKKSGEYLSLIDTNKHLLSVIKQTGFYDMNEEKIKEHIMKSFASNYNRIETSHLKEYDEAVKSLLNTEEFTVYNKIKKDNRSFGEFIFSIKNREVSGVLYKVITILGFQFKIKK